MTQNSMQLRHQNFMWAVRQALGWPLFKPACDSLAFASGRVHDAAVGLDLARHAQTMRKDLVYAGWHDADADEPAGFTIVLRELLSVDVFSRCLLYAADETSPAILVSTTADEHVAVGKRGLLERRPGKPRDLARGRKIAMRRVRRAAAAMGDRICPENVIVPNGGDYVAPPSPSQGLVARFC